MTISMVNLVHFQLVFNKEGSSIKGFLTLGRQVDLRFNSWK